MFLSVSAFAETTVEMTASAATATHRAFTGFISLAPSQLFFAAARGFASSLASIQPVSFLPIDPAL
jgi:hypothetical protein